MVFIGGILSFIVLVTVLTKGYSQTLDEHTGNVTNCFNGVVEGSCVQATERAFVTKVNAGVKPSSPNPYNCTPYWEVGIAEQCCRKGNGDCIGPYLAVATDPFVFHKDCLGKNQCTRRAAARMDTIYHTHCDHAAYPQQTSYMEIEFLCIDVSKITSITGDPKRNDGQGSTLYLWSGDASSYLPLTTATHECSVETDCDDTIIVISVDLRFATDDANMTCIPEKVLRISDGDQSVQFDCSENNNFTIETLYTSVSNYITLSMENVVNGGHLWLAFQTTMNGNLTVNCRSKDRQNYCEETTTMEDTTTETFTTTESFTTTETFTTETFTTTESFTTTQSLIESSTTMDINTTKFESTTVDTPAADKKIGLVVGAVIGALAFLGVMIVIIVVMVKRNKNRKKCEEKQEDKLTSDIESGKTPEANGFPSVPPTNHGIINADKSGQNDDSLHNSMANEHLLSINENQDNNMFDATVNGWNGLRKNQVLPILGQVGTVDPINNTLTEDTGEERKRKKKKRKRNVESLNENAENDEENQEEKKKKKKKKRKKIDNENEANLEEEPQSYVDETNVQKERKKKKKRKERNDEEHDEEHDDDLDKFNSVTEERKQRKKRKKKIIEEHEGVEHEGEEHRVNNEPELDNSETEESKERKKKKKKRKKKKKVTHLDDEDEAVTDVISINNN